MRQWPEGCENMDGRVKEWMRGERMGGGVRD